MRTGRVGIYFALFGLVLVSQFTHTFNHMRVLKSGKQPWKIWVINFHFTRARATLLKYFIKTVPSLYKSFVENYYAMYITL